MKRLLLLFPERQPPAEVELLATTASPEAPFKRLVKVEVGLFLTKFPKFFIPRPFTPVTMAFSVVINVPSKAFFYLV